MVIHYGPISAYIQLDDLIITDFPNMTTRLHDFAIAVPEKGGSWKDILMVTNKTKEELITLIESGALISLLTEKEYISKIEKNKEELLSYIRNGGGFCELSYNQNKK